MFERTKTMMKAAGISREKNAVLTICFTETDGTRIRLRFRENDIGTLEFIKVLMRMVDVCLNKTKTG